MNDFERASTFVHGIDPSFRLDRSPVALRQPRYLNLELPSVWSRNYLLATENARPRPRPTTLAAETDRILGGARLRHRKVELTDDAAGERLEPGFRALGWDSECDVIMVARRDPDRPVDTSIVDEVSLDDLEPAWADGWRTDPRSSDDGGRAAARRRTSGVPDRGRGHEVLRGPRRRRDRELLRALLRRAASARSRTSSHSSRFRKRRPGPRNASPRLSGEARRRRPRPRSSSSPTSDDWPKELYGKLGFDEVGRIWEFVLPRAK